MPAFRVEGDATATLRGSAFIYLKITCIKRNKKKSMKYEKYKKVQKQVSRKCKFKTINDEDV